MTRHVLFTLFLVAIGNAPAASSSAAAPRRPTLARFGSYTKPKAGPAKDYVYLVTAAGPGKIAKVIANGGRFDKIFFASLIADRSGVTKTIGNIGFVLDAPEENVIGTSARDTAVQFSTTYMTIPQIMQQVKFQYPPLVSGFGSVHVPQPLGYRHVPDSPKALLAKTTYFNEILVLDEGLSGARTTITGMFTRVGASVNDRTAAEDAARTLKVPLIELPSLR